MTSKRVLTLENIFDEQTYIAPNKWDVTWLNDIKIPENIALNAAQAMKTMTDTARAVEWCGEKIALLMHLVSQAEDDYKKEWSSAFITRSKSNAANQKKVEADADPTYLAKKAIHSRLKGYFEYFKQKQSGFMTIHHAVKEIVKLSHNEFGVANWATTADSFAEPAKEPEQTESESSEPEEDFQV